MRNLSRLLSLGVCVLLSPECASGQPGPMMPAPQVRAWRKANAGTEKTFAPVLKENSVQFGSKMLQMTADGKFQCVTPDCGVLFTGDASFYLKTGGKTLWSWRRDSLDREKSKFYRDGRKYIWELWYKDKVTPSFPGLKQILEVLPDGRLGFSYQFNLPPDSAERTFKAWTFTISLPESSWLDRTAVLDGRQMKLTPGLKNYSAPGKEKQLDWLLGKDDPSKKFLLRTVRAEGGTPGMMYRGSGRNREFLIHFNHRAGNGVFYRFILDLRQGTDSGGRDIRGGIDFKAQEDMLLPDNRHANPVVNASFERGFEGWLSRFKNFDQQWDWEPFTPDDKEAYEGNRSLRLDVHKFYPRAQTKMANIGPFHTVCEPGTWTVSFYAKGLPGKNSVICCWIPNFHRGNPFLPLHDTACWKFSVTPEWKRYQASFEVKSGEPVVNLSFFGSDESGSGTIWLDAVQLNRGKTASKFQPPPAEGRLLTSAPDNFISSTEKIDGKLRITTAKPNMAGKVRITVKNFFGEILLDLKKDFKSGKDRTAELALPLDELPGLGVFVLKAEYTLADGSSAYDFRRYTRIKFLTGPQPMKPFYCMDYDDPSRGFDFLKQLDRWNKLGVGGKHHVIVREKKVWDTYEKYHVKPFSNFLLNYRRGNSGPHISNFFIIDVGRIPMTGIKPDDPRIIFWDYHQASGGKITPEYLNKLRLAAKTMAAKYPHVGIWTLGGELTCKMPNDWWGKGDTDRDVAHKIALHLKAVAEGIREGNPRAKVYQDDPANMAPRGGIAETGRLLEECNKLGVKFDLIAIHPYRFSPENPDLDDDTAKFLQVLDRHGCGNTPVYWPEGMHWGPFDLPQWGTKSSSAQNPPRTWRGSISYDMGWTEKKSAAWYARAWLVALKYSDRIIGATSGQFINNCYMDYLLTPYAAQLVPNTLCSIFGKIRFRKDIRFAPYTRAYIFEDDQKRPIAAVWTHDEQVDSGSADAPAATADFGDSLEAVIDLMNTNRAFKPGVMTFPVTPFPLFFRGKPGTLKQMTDAFEKTELVSGSSASSLAMSVTPAGSGSYLVRIRNYISKDFNGKLNGKAVRVPASGIAEVELPLATPLKKDSIIRQEIPLKLVSDDGREYSRRLELNAFTVKRVAADATVDTLDWESLPKIPFNRTVKNRNRTSGFFRTGWNPLGLFIEGSIRDDKFVHVEYPNPFDRWKNDCLQIYFDTLANAATRILPECDEDDYEYAVFPNSKGTSAQVFRYRTVDPQLGLATQAPPDETFAPDIPCRFVRKDGLLIYRVFFPAKYLLPMKLQKGWSFGFCLFAPDSNKENSADDYLTLATDGKLTHDRPKFWPMAVLEE